MYAKIALVTLATVCCVQVLTAAPSLDSTGSSVSDLFQKKVGLAEYERTGKVGQKFLTSCYNAYYYVKQVIIEGKSMPGKFADVSRQLEQGLVSCNSLDDEVKQENCRKEQRSRAHADRMDLLWQGAGLVVKGVYGTLCILKCIGSI